MTLLSACAVRSAALVLLVALALAAGSPARAQNEGTQEPGRFESFKNDVGGAFGRIFGGSDRIGDGQRNGRGGGEAPSTVVAQMSASELTMRLDRMENQIRQLTGMVEQLQFRNQQLEQQVRRGQEDADYRFQELGGRGGGGAARAPRQSPPAAAPLPPQPPSVPPPGQGRRSDVYDPSENPGAPGAPQVLGALPPGRPSAPLASPPIIDEEPQGGVPGGRPSGAPLDLSTLSDNAANDPELDPRGAPPSVIAAAPGAEPRMIPGALPPPPPRNTNATGAQPQIAMAPSQTPRDELALGQGLVQRKDYAAAEDSLRAFLKKYPNDKLVSDAHYWLGESLYQRQRYRDAAESFLNISTKFESSGRAPDALVRLGQSLAALGEREAACATLGEVGRKYPRASSGVKQSVEREQKRAKC